MTKMTVKFAGLRCTRRRGVCAVSHDAIQNAMTVIKCTIQLQVDSRRITFLRLSIVQHWNLAKIVHYLLSVQRCGVVTLESGQKNTLDSLTGFDIVHSHAL